MKAFLSYSRRNGPAALRLAQRLKQLGAAVWIDQVDITPGLPWDEAVERGLRTADAVVVLLSADAVRSANVLDEIAFALEFGKRLIPVLLEPCEKPLRLSRLQHIDLTEDWEGATLALAAQIGSAVSSADHTATPGVQAQPHVTLGRGAQQPQGEPRAGGGRRRLVVLLGLFGGVVLVAVLLWQRTTAPAVQGALSPVLPASAPLSAAASGGAPREPCTLPFDNRPITCLEPGK